MCKPKISEGLSAQALLEWCRVSRVACVWQRCYMPVVPNLGPPDVLGLQLPKAFTTTSAGQDFWELKSKNIWRPKVGEHCSTGGASLCSLGQNSPQKKGMVVHFWLHDTYKTLKRVVMMQHKVIVTWVSGGPMGLLPPAFLTQNYFHVPGEMHSVVVKQPMCTYYIT